MAHHDGASHASADDQYLETPPGAGYEHTDAYVWIIAKFLGWLAVAAIVIHVGLGFLFGVFVEQRVTNTPLQYPLAAPGQSVQLPPEPRLQRFPREDITTFRTAEEATLNSYGWVNKDAGIVHIPISDAVKLTLERGLPTRGGKAAAPVVVPPPTDSSAGRTVAK